MVVVLCQGLAPLHYNYRRSSYPYPHQQAEASPMQPSNAEPCPFNPSHGMNSCSMHILYTGLSWLLLWANGYETLHK